jgi:hypothetical protein
VAQCLPSVHEALGEKEICKMQARLDSPFHNIAHIYCLLEAMCQVPGDNENLIGFIFGEGWFFVFCFGFCLFFFF